MLLSIIIPTKDRYYTLIPVVKALLNHIIGDNFEIIVHDNSLDNKEGIREFSKINDDRVRYFHYKEKLTVSENSHLAIGCAKGEYLLFIGDDDLVSPYVLKIVQLIKDKSIDCLIYNKGNYYWPNTVFQKEYAFNHPSHLQFTRNYDLVFTTLKTQEVFKATLRKGGTFLFDMPALYHGIVNKKTMDQVLKKFGSYVPGSSPDMAIAAALSSILEEHHYVNYPVSITGASKKSAAGMGIKNEHIAKIEDVPWLPIGLAQRWDEKIPKIWTGLTIYAQTISEVLKVANSELKLNYKQLYIEMYFYNPSVKKIVKPYILNIQQEEGILMQFKAVFKQKIRAVIWASPSIVLNTFIFMRGDFKRKKQFKDVLNVDTCMRILKENTKV
jgi:glycosyltransferase involved in cell wall biosynthesis